MPVTVIHTPNRHTRYQIVAKTPKGEVFHYFMTQRKSRQGILNCLREYPQQIIDLTASEDLEFVKKDPRHAIRIGEWFFYFTGETSTTLHNKTMPWLLDKEVMERYLPKS